MRGRPPPPITPREHLAWACAIPARADAAIRHRATRYGTAHHAIRAKLHKGLTSGSMALGSLLDVERWRLMGDRVCACCGSAECLSLDRLMARARGAGDRPGNLVLACRSRNGARRDRGMATWLASWGEFPPLMLLRRHLKLAFAIGEERGWLDRPVHELHVQAPPFEIDDFPPHPGLEALRH